MSTSQNDDQVTPPGTGTAEPHAPNAADAHALAAAGAEAAANATPGTDQATLKRLIKEAVKEEADERNLKGFNETDAQMVATTVILALESRGAFAQSEEPANTSPNPQPNAQGNEGNGEGTQGNNNPPPPAEEVAPKKVTFAEKFMRGSK